MSGVSRLVRYQAFTASTSARYRALSRTKPLSPVSRTRFTRHSTPPVTASSSLPRRTHHVGTPNP